MVQAFAEGHYDKADPTPGFRWPADMADSYAKDGGGGKRRAPAPTRFRIFDKIPAPKPEPGAIGFRTRYQQLSVDNFRVSTP